MSILTKIRNEAFALKDSENEIKMNLFLSPKCYAELNKAIKDEANGLGWNIDISQVEIPKEKGEYVVIPFVGVINLHKQEDVENYILSRIN